MNNTSTLPTQQLIYTISVFDEDTILTDHRNKDRQFIVSGEELQKMFASKITLIPEPGLHWMVQDGNKRTCLLEIPRQKAPYHIGYRGKGKKEEILELFMPSMVFMFEVSTGKDLQTSVHNVRGWCFSGKLKDSTKLYGFPLPNFGGASLCTGTANKAHNGTLRDTIEQIVFDSWFNNHNQRCGKAGLVFPEFYAQCEGKIRLSQCKKIGTGKDILHPHKH